MIPESSKCECYFHSSAVVKHFIPRCETDKIPHATRAWVHCRNQRGAVPTESTFRFTDAMVSSQETLPPPPLSLFHTCPHELRVSLQYLWGKGPNLPPQKLLCHPTCPTISESFPHWRIFTPEMKLNIFSDYTNSVQESQLSRTMHRPSTINQWVFVLMVIFAGNHKLCTNTQIFVGNY